MNRFLFLLLISATVVQLICCQCGQEADALEGCFNEISATAEFQTLLATRQKVWDICVAQNKTLFQPCMDEQLLLESCDAKISLDPDVLQAKQQMINRSDNCFNKLHLSDKLNGISPGAPTTNIRGIRAVPFGQQETTDLPPLLPPGISLPIPAAFGSTQTVPLLPSNLQSFPNSELQPSEQICFAFFDCIARVSPKQSEDDISVAAAREVHAYRMKCVNEHPQSFECSVVSPHIATCLTSAAQDFEELRSQKLQKCLQRGVNKVVQSTVEVPIDVPGGRLKPIQIEAGDSRDSIGDGGIRQPKIPFSSIRDIPSLTQLLPQVNTEPLEPHQLVSSVAEEKFPLELLPMKHNKNSANQTV